MQGRRSHTSGGLRWSKTQFLVSGVTGVFAQQSKADVQPVVDAQVGVAGQPNQPGHPPPAARLPSTGSRASIPVAPETKS